MWSTGKKENWFALGCGPMVLIHLHFCLTSEENGFFAYGCCLKCQWLHNNASFVPCLCMRSASQAQSHSLCHFCACPASACALQQSFCCIRSWFWEASEPPWASSSAGWGKAATVSHLSLPLWGPHCQRQCWCVQRELSHLSVTMVTSDLGPVSWTPGARDASACAPSLFPENNSMFSSYYSPGVQIYGKEFPLHFSIVSEAVFYFQEKHLASKNIFKTTSLLWSSFMHWMYINIFSQKKCTEGY